MSWSVELSNPNAIYGLKVYVIATFHYNRETVYYSADGSWNSDINKAVVADLTETAEVMNFLGALYEFGTERKALELSLDNEELMSLYSYFNETQTL